MPDSKNPADVIREVSAVGTKKQYAPKKNLAATIPLKECVKPCNIPTRPKENIVNETERRWLSVNLSKTTAWTRLNARHTCGLSFFSRAFEGSSKRMYGTKLV